MIRAPHFLALALSATTLAGPRRRLALWAAVVVGMLAILLIAYEFLPGAALYRRATAGDPAAQYEYARWNENDRIPRDLLAGYEWLERSAAQDYPPAVFALGARLKHGEHVPRPADWSGPSGNTFNQPIRGQKLIDKGLELGFRPKTDDLYFYWFEYWTVPSSPRLSGVVSASVSCPDTA